MKYPQYTLQLHCNVCGRETDRVDIDDEMTEEEYDKWQNFCDRRCTECENDFGTFAELSEKYRQGLEGKTHAYLEAEEFIKKNRKRADFEVALSTEKEKRLKDKNIIE